MPTLPSQFSFIPLRPCVQFYADGLPPGQQLTCLVDFGTPGYLLLLYWHAIHKVRIVGYGGNNIITLLDGGSYNVQAVYLDVDWWNYRSSVRTNILHAVRYGSQIDGHGGLDFFPLRTLTIDCQNRITTVA